MANGDALSRYLGNAFPTVNPPIANDIGRGTAGAGAGLGGAYAPAGTNNGPSTASTPGTTPSGGGGGSAPAAPTNPPLDWHAYLTNWGFTSDIVDELDRIFRTYSDPSQASAAALAYVRGTDWYAQTFPGITEGEKLGVISDESSYRAYVNQLNDLYHRYGNSPVTGDQVSSALKSGYSVTHVGQQLQGAAYVAANGSDINYTLGAYDPQGALSNTDLQAYGEDQAGLTNALGPEIDKRISLAKQKLAGAFQGVLANPSLTFTRGRLAAPSLAGGINPGDVSS